jgi:hypothetical protein
MIFSCHLEGHWRKYQDPEPDPDPLVKGRDPDPYQNVMDPQHWFPHKLGNKVKPPPKSQISTASATSH